jgi:hypothetical protein
LQLNGQYVAQVPLLNFQTFAPDKVYRLIEVSESATRRFNFYTYSVSTFLDTRFVERWASWLTHRDLRAINISEPGHETDMHKIICDTERIGDVDYQDALIDAWVSSLQADKAEGTLDVGRMRRHSPYRCPASLIDLKCVLILHHDARSAAVNSEKSSGERSYYTEAIRSKVRHLALSHFVQPGSEPKDPLQLSDHEFCNKYHTHHKNGQPCYKTKSLPGKT